MTSNLDVSYPRMSKVHTNMADPLQEYANCIVAITNSNHCEVILASLTEHCSPSYLAFSLYQASFSATSPMGRTH